MLLQSSRKLLSNSLILEVFGLYSRQRSKLFYRKEVYSNKMATTSSSLITTLALIQQRAGPYIYCTELALEVISSILNILVFSRRQFRTMSVCICKYFLF